MVRRQSVAFAWLAATIAMLVPAKSAVACSPPFQPTIEELGPAQVVVVGTIGERVAGGRLFHVERWFNGNAAVTPIVIAFKEGPAVGDCSYPVETGQHLIIAPMMEGGRLTADLGTLQADPDTVEGRRYVEDATKLFGPGVEPIPTAVEIEQPLWAVPNAGLGVLALTALVGLFLVLQLQRRGRRTGN